MDKMTEHRKRRLRALIADKPYGSQQAFARAAGLTEGRIAQMLKPSESFGEVSAKRLAIKLDLPERYFEAEFSADDQASGTATEPIQLATTGDVTPATDEMLIALTALTSAFNRADALTMAQVRPLFSMLLGIESKGSVAPGIITQRLAELLGGQATGQIPEPKSRPKRSGGLDLKIKIEDGSDGSSDTAAKRKREAGRR